MPHHSYDRLGWVSLPRRVAWPAFWASTRPGPRRSLAGCPHRGFYRELEMRGCRADLNPD